MKVRLQDIVVVTSNKNKVSEINEILGTNHQVSKIDIPEIQSLDLNKVVTYKAKEAYRRIKKPVLVEDISFNIHALKGLPGPFVKFFMQTLGTEGTAKLVGKTKTDTTVVAAVAIYDGKELKIFKGEVLGTLSRENRGTSGFYFDRIFIPKGYKQTYAEMPPSLKNIISHRAKALRKLKKYLSNGENL